MKRIILIVLFFVSFFVLVAQEIKFYDELDLECTKEDVVNLLGEPDKEFDIKHKYSSIDNAIFYNNIPLANYNAKLQISFSNGNFGYASYHLKIDKKLNYDGSVCIDNYYYTYIDFIKKLKVKYGEPEFCKLLDGYKEKQNSFAQSCWRDRLPIQTEFYDGKNKIQISFNCDKSDHINNYYVVITYFSNLYIKLHDAYINSTKGL